MFEWSSVCGARPAVMGVVNVTPDSFSDGGRYLDASAAVAHGLDLVADGADLLEIGGESTRPGAEPVAERDELDRVVTVVERLTVESGVPVSIDTTKAAVARAAIEAGAAIVNDVSAGAMDPDLVGVVGDAGAGYVAMHMLGEPRTMQDNPRYDDVTIEVGSFLVDRIEVARRAGVAAAAIAVDPGIGFGKTVAHNLEVLARLRELVDRVGVPVMIGTSRKRFLGSLLATADGADAPAAVDRDDATLATVVWAVDHGARIVRVHDARRAARSVALLEAVREAAA